MRYIDQVYLQPKLFSSVAGGKQDIIASANPLGVSLKPRNASNADFGLSAEVKGHFSWKRVEFALY